MARKLKPHTRPGKRLRPETTADRVVSFRLSGDDLERIAAIAAADGLTPAAWIRTAALGTAVLPEPDRQRVTAGAAT